MLLSKRQINETNIGRFEIRTLTILLGSHFYKGREENELACYASDVRLDLEVRLIRFLLRIVDARLRGLARGVIMDGANQQS